MAEQWDKNGGQGIRDLETEHLAGKFLHDCLFADVGRVAQEFYKVSSGFEKRRKLLKLLSCPGGGKTVVFVERKTMADFLAVYLSENDIPTTSIHGDRFKRERIKALKDFNYGQMLVLFSTSIADRGLDIKKVTCVVNFDMPKSIDEYVHRIGQIGRLRNRVRATSFYDGEVDKPRARHLVRILFQILKG